MKKAALDRVLRGLKQCHDQKKKQFIVAKKGHRGTLLAQYAGLYGLKYGNDTHNEIIWHLDAHHPGWRGYDIDVKPIPGMTNPSPFQDSRTVFRRGA